MGVAGEGVLPGAELGGTAVGTKPRELEAEEVEGPETALAEGERRLAVHELLEGLHRIHQHTNGETAGAHISNSGQFHEMWIGFAWIVHPRLNKLKTCPLSLSDGSKHPTKTRDERD